MAKDFRENFVNLSNYWDSKIGLAFFYFVFYSSYFGFVYQFLKENIIDDKLVLALIIPFIFSLGIYLIWSFRSNRLNLYKKKIITTGLFLKCDDFDSEVKVRKIINEMISEIESDLRDVKLKFFPINHVRNENELEKFVSNNSHIIDNAFFATIHNGNCIEGAQTLFKIEIQNLSFSGQFNSKNKKDFRAKVNMSKDLNLRNLDKNWEYIESRSFNDKVRIKHNLKDSILFFNGLYSIYMKELDLALNIFKHLKISKKISENQDNVSRIKNERLKDILLSLFTFNAIETYLHKKDIETAYKLLKECELIFKDNHRFTFSNNITLARIYFEKGNIVKAKEYTNDAKTIKSDVAPIYCNLAFFAIIENNIEQVYYNYKELGYVYKFKGSLDFIEIIHFLELYKSKYPDSDKLFEFAIATLNFLYVDYDLGKSKLLELKEVFNENSEYAKINDLTGYFLTKGSFKSPYFQRDKKNKRLGK